MISRVKGTHDILDFRLLSYVQKLIHQQACYYHFNQIETPILEHTELFKRSLGLQTDVVSKEMFIIGDTSNPDSLCLRPEATAAAMRVFLEHKEQLLTPWKAYSIGPMFRHERPQKGRFREFHQVTFEIIGSHAVSQDVQLIKMLDRLFQEECKLDVYALLINYLGCFDDRQRFKKILYEFLNGIQSQLCADCLIRKEHNIMRVFDCKVPTCHALYENAPRIADNLCTTCDAEWHLLQDQLQLLSVSFSYSPYLVRGLDYYDKTVFEFVSDNLGSQRAFCGGGRYNRLATQLGAPNDVPAVGASIGIERLSLLLEPMTAQLPLEMPPALHMIIPLGKEQQALALLLADELQAQHLCVDIMLEDDLLKTMMRKANKMGAKYVLLIGSQEREARKVMVKDMVTGNEELVDQAALVHYLKK